MSHADPVRHEEDSWSTCLEQRVAALVAMFGPHDRYLVSPLPFALGGGVTTLRFPHVDPTFHLYCTCELTGGWGSKQIPGSRGEFELLIAVPRDSQLQPRDGQKGMVGVIFDYLATISREALLDHGHTLGPLESQELYPMTHMILLNDAPPRPFAFGGRSYGLLTAFLLLEEEFRFGRKDKEGLIRLIRGLGSVPVSSLERQSLLCQ